MRFFEDGPNIPDDLLEARDQGEVIFLCGAGISMPAGLPNFAQLARSVVEQLGVPENAIGRRLLDRALAEADPKFAPPMDQVFGELQREYGVSRIESIINRKLASPRKPYLNCHQAILQLSKNTQGHSRVVTTNFDHLFDACDSGLRKYISPVLPDLANGIPLKGVVYLHGSLPRIRASEDETRGLIIGSADFGRAYLADGWATRFVRQLIDRFTVVLLGYSADDPPIRYLLQGLHSKGALNAPKIYAFSEGEPGEVDARWWDRGIRAISYPKTDEKHPALWNSIFAWAKRANDPDKWRAEVIENSRRGPLALRPHERGQVAALLETNVGAKEFADSLPIPPAEWIAVLDAAVRYARPTEIRKEDQTKEKYDPLELYGLDDDPPRPKEGGRRQNTLPGIDVLSTMPGETRTSPAIRLCGVNANRPHRLPPRLFHLSRWIAFHSESPIMLWWAAGASNLHETTKFLIATDISRKKNLKLQRAWTLVLEALDNSSNEDGGAWYDLKPRIDAEGWTPTNVRKLRSVLSPKITVKRPMLSDAIIPQSVPTNFEISNLVSLEVAFPKPPYNEILIPNDAIEAVTATVRKELDEGRYLLQDLGTRFWRTVSLYRPENGDQYLGGYDALFLWFARLFEQLCKHDIKAAKVEFQNWPYNEPFFFDKLRIWALAKKELCAADDAARQILVLSDSSFWSSYLERELLRMLVTRWPRLTPNLRKRIEQRIVAGPPRWTNEKIKEWRQRKGAAAATRLGWLLKHGCKLSYASKHILPKLRAADPRWSEAWVDHADDSREPRGGYVRPDYDSSKLENLPIAKLAVEAGKTLEREFGILVSYQPFAGLVQTKPTRALAGLSFAARNGNFPERLWRELLEHWPDGASTRATWLLASRISKLPTAIMIELRHYIPRWLQKNMQRVLDANGDDAWRIWDAIEDILGGAGGHATESAIGDVTVAGIPQNRSRRTLDHAINGPIGVLAEILISALSSKLKRKGQRIPAPFRLRIDKLLSASADGKDHATSILAQRLRWLNWLDPQWTRENLVPFFSPDSPQAEPAWSGYLHDNALPEPKLFALLKPSFLALFDKARNWRWESRASIRLSQFLVIATFWGRRNKSYLSFDEARNALRSITDDDRFAALGMLHNAINQKGFWAKSVKPFIEHAWPNEERYQTASSSAQFINLATDANDNFVDIVKTILPFIRPSERADVFVFQMKKNKKGKAIAEKYPRETLSLLDRLVPDDPEIAPYELTSLLDMLAGADPSIRQDLRWRRLRALM